MTKLNKRANPTYTIKKHTYRYTPEEPIKLILKIFYNGEQIMKLQAINGDIEILERRVPLVLAASRVRGD